MALSLYSQLFLPFVHPSSPNPSIEYGCKDIFIDFIVKIMSKPLESTPPAAVSKPPLDKTQLLSDIIVFLSIVLVLPFFTFTLRFTFFQAFSFTLQDTDGLTYIFLWYASGILLLRVIAAGIRRFKKEDIEIVKDIESAGNSSLLRVLFVTSVYIFTVREWSQAEIGMAEICQTAAWLFAAELNLTSCALVPKHRVIQAFTYFGWGVEALLVLGQIARIWSFDYFNIL